MQIQAYLTAAAINLKRLAAALRLILTVLRVRIHAAASRTKRFLDRSQIRFVPLAQSASA